MVTFETKCYENDWEFILKGNRLETMIERCNTTFSRKVVIINNVNDLNTVKQYADKKVKKGTIDEYIIAEDHAAEALAFFDITKDSFKGGYYYSIAELVGIFLCKTPYLLHFSSDTILDKSRTNWIADAIKTFEERKDIFVANPTWNFMFESAGDESFDSTDKFYLGYGFSDQCYLIRTADFRQRIYHEQHVNSARYPEYGGELFEKRVDSYMQNHQLLRITSKETSYIHKNFPKEKWQRFRTKLDGVFNRY